MKFHFGHGVLIGGLLFIAFIIYLVSQMLGQRIDLVDREYYKKGLDYQAVINQKQNQRTAFQLKQVNNQLQLELKEALQATETQIRFYRPSDSRQDTTFKLTLNQQGGTLSLPDLAKGQWRITLYWQEQGVTYSQEADLFWQ